MEYKALSLVDAEFKIAADTGSFTGYASTFGNVDSYGDTIVKGAYAQTLKKNGLPKMFFNHQASAVPIGKWINAVEDEKGLLLTGEFTPGHALAGEVRAALKHGTIDSMSIGYALQKNDYEETDTGRIIKNVSFLAETSIVNFPADKFATVDLSSVKSYADEINSITSVREFENFLRDAGGLSKGAALALTACAKELFHLRDVDKAEIEAKQTALILERIRQISA